MQNSGVNIIALETYSAFCLFQFVSFWRRVRSIMYLLLLFASLGTLYEPSRGTHILTIVYNDTIIAKEMFESSFFLSAMRFASREIARAIYHLSGSYSTVK